MESFMRALSFRWRPVLDACKLRTSKLHHNPFLRREINTSFHLITEFRGNCNKYSSFTQSEIGLHDKRKNYCKNQSKCNDEIHFNEEIFAENELLDNVACESTFQYQVNNLSSVTEVLDFISNIDTWNESKALYVFLKFRKFGNMSEDGNSEDENLLNVEFLQKNHHFVKVMEIIERFLPLLDPYKLILILKVCIKMKIPPTSIFCQKVTKLLIDNMNTLSVIDVISLYILLSQLPKAKVSNFKTLTSATLVYIIHKFKDGILFSRYDFKSLKQMVYFSSLDVLPSFIRTSLLSCLLESDLSLYDLKLLSQILYSWVSVAHKPVPVSNLIKVLKKKLSESRKFCKNSRDILFLSKNYLKGVIKGNFTYDGELCDMMASFSATDQYLSYSVETLDRLCCVRHLHYPLVEYILMKFSEDAFDFCGDEYAFRRLLRIFSVIRVHTLKNINWNFYKQKLQSLLKTAKIRDGDLVTITLDLVSLGIFDYQLIDKVFDELSHEWKRVDPLEWDRFAIRNALLLHHCIFVLHPSYKGRNFSSEAVSRLSEIMAKKYLTFSWKEKVEKFFGGEKYVLTSCTTLFNHALCYAVFLDPVNFQPIDMTCHKQAAEPRTAINITHVKAKESHAHVIIIQEFYEEGVTFRNVPITLGKPQLYINILEALGYNVIPVESEWPDNDKFQVLSDLTSKIKKKLEGYCQKEI